MLKSVVHELIESALEKGASELGLPNTAEALAMLNVERPKQLQFGDFAINVSPLAKLAKKAPPQIAQTLVNYLPNNGFEPNLVGGFINFKLDDTLLSNALASIIQTEQPGSNTSQVQTHCLLEFVSANPTGPLHIGHGRWVALGNSLARLLTHCGAQVTQEFYVNDAGSQMVNIANSLWYRSLELLNTGGKLPEPVEGQPYPFYPGEYVIDLAKTVVESHTDQILAWDSPSHKPPAEATEFFKGIAKMAMLAEQKALMARCGLVFDVFFSEQTLHDQNLVAQTIDKMRERGVIYDKDGAVWFKASEFGDDQDRVLIKSDGNYTYLTADIAYHHEKFTRNNGFYNLAINIWGADHHGYIPRMKAALQALGYNPDQLEIVLGQLVNLIVDGERTRMGKRKKMLTLQDLVDEVGVDALRFWMVLKSQDSTLDFNVDLASSASDDNPVYYVQYAHARCASILRNALQERLDTESQTTRPALLTQAEWDNTLSTITSNELLPLFTSLDNPQAAEALKTLILKLDSFEDVVSLSARNRTPHTMARYLLDLAADFHHFYNVCRILVDDSPILKARLALIVAVKKVLKTGLGLLGVSAPDSM